MEESHSQLNYNLILEKIYEATAEICAILKEPITELKSRNLTSNIQTDAQTTSDYLTNQNTPEEELTEIKEELIIPYKSLICNFEEQKKQRLRFETTKQRYFKEERNRHLTQRMGLLFFQSLLQATKIDLLAEREVSLWKPTWHRKKARIRLKREI